MRQGGTKALGDSTIGWDPPIVGADSVFGQLLRTTSLRYHIPHKEKAYALTPKSAVRSHFVLFNVANTQFMYMGLSSP
jgi:hypothetical protein